MPWLERTFSLRQRTGMPRRPKPSPSRPSADYLAAAALRPRLEKARLELLPLFRALDQLHFGQHLPSELRELFELDADFAEALCVLDQPARRLDWAAMTRDTLASLEDLEPARTYFLDLLPPADRTQLLPRVEALRSTLKPEDAYLQIPGRDPTVR